MPHGGKRPGAGRKKGSLTGKTREIVRQATEQGVTPLEVMLRAMLHYHEAGDRDRAAAIAKDAAPYCHPRLSAMQVSGGPTPVRLNLVEEIVIVPGGASANGNGNGDGGNGHADGQAPPGAG